MCTDHETPMIELHDLTGEPLGIRREIIAVVKAAGIDGAPNCGAFVLTDQMAFEVLETPGDILRLIRGEVVAVVKVEDIMGNEVARYPAGDA